MKPGRGLRFWRRGFSDGGHTGRFACLIQEIGGARRHCRRYERLCARDGAAACQFGNLIKELLAYLYLYLAAQARFQLVKGLAALAADDLCLQLAASLVLLAYFIAYLLL